MPILDFKGKSIVYSHHLTVPSRTLEVDVKKSLPLKGGKPSLDDNLIIHGKIRKQRGKDGSFYETNDRLFYLTYEPKLAFLRSSESALNSERAERIAKEVKKKKKTAIVFATHKFMGQKELTDLKIVFFSVPWINSLSI